MQQQPEDLAKLWVARQLKKNFLWLFPASIALVFGVPQIITLPVVLALLGLHVWSGMQLGRIFAQNTPSMRIGEEEDWSELRKWGWTAIITWYMMISIILFMLFLWVDYQFALGIWHQIEGAPK